MQTGLHLAQRIKNNSFFSSRLFNRLLNKSLLKSGKCTSDYIHYLLDNAAIIQLITGCIEKSDNFSCHYLFVMNASLDYIGSIPKTRSKKSGCLWGITSKHFSHHFIFSWCGGKVYTADLKSAAVNPACGFKSHHQ